MNRHKVTAIRTDVIEQWFVPDDVRGAIKPCRNCGDESAWLSLGGAMAVTGLRAEVICNLAENGDVHSLLSSQGHLLICAVSIGNYITNKGDK